MSIGTEIIKDALEEIGAHSVASPANPESIEAGRKKLNSMMETWLSQGIKTGFTPIAVPGDNLNEPADIRNGVVSNLAVLMAPSFDNGKVVVSPNLMATAGKTFRQIRKTYEDVTVPRKGVSSTLPIGQGNKTGTWQNPFFGPDASIDG